VNRRSFLFLLLISLTGAANAAAAEPWRFIMVCDTRSNTASGINDQVVRELTGEILRGDVDFVIIAGDLASGARAGAPRFETQLWSWVAAMKPIYDAGIPVYVCRGNHELGDMWDAGPGEPPNSLDNYAKRWLKVFGGSPSRQRLPDNGPADERYMSYSVAHRNALIVALDQYAGIEHRIVHSLNQSWLDSLLANNARPHVFVFGHEPAFRALHADCLDAHPVQRDAFWHSLRAAGARLYFCGHDHFYDHALVNDGDGDPNDDIHQYIVGTGGAPFYSWTPPYDGNNGAFQVTQVRHAQAYGYVLVDVDDLKVTVTWMERQTSTLSQPGVYQPKDAWSYTAAGCQVKLAADLNGDCRVDFADLAILASEWLASGKSPSPPPDPKK
jgi:hypothetical protein